MPAPRLPLETSEAIIDLLHNDHESLYACSLTCKGWIPRSRSHIFSRVSLRNVQGSLPNFLNVIQSLTRPGQYVRSLFLDFHIPYTYAGLHDYSWAQERSALPILAANLPNVRNLELGDIEWEMLDVDGRTAILSGLQSVRHLTLDAESFNTFTEFAELILSFPALEHFVCNNDFTILDRSQALPAHLEPPSLHKLQLHGYKTSKIMEWFMSGQNPCDISSLEVTVAEAETHELSNVFEFLQALGPRLKHLHLALHFSEIYPWDHPPEDVDLTHNTSLVSLRLSRVFHASKRITTAYLEYLAYIPRLISHIRSSQLESLWIDSRIKDETLDNLAWGDIEDALSHPRFSRLKNLTFFNHSAEVDMVNLRNHVGLKMPSLTERQILHFCEAQKVYDDAESTYSSETSF